MQTHINDDESIRDIAVSQSRRYRDHHGGRNASIIFTAESPGLLDGVVIGGEFMCSECYLPSKVIHAHGSLFLCQRLLEYKVMQMFDFSPLFYRRPF